MLLKLYPKFKNTLTLIHLEFFHSFAQYELRIHSFKRTPFLQRQTIEPSEFLSASVKVSRVSHFIYHSIDTIRAFCEFLILLSHQSSVLVPVLSYPQSNREKRLS